MTGFRLTATFRAKPTATASTVVAPDYSCLPHSFGFRGAGAGASGPQVTVRLGLLQSPFYDRLLRPGIQAENPPPYCDPAQPRAVPPPEWLGTAPQGSARFRRPHAAAR